ncbi:MAG: hypothetical protein RR967_02500 [Anaerovoracaceae bacterium]
MPVGEHVTHGDVLEYKPLPKEGGTLQGNYFIDKGSISLSESIVIEEGTILNICLNGSSLYRNFDGNLFINHGTLNIGTCDKSDISDWYTNSGTSEYEKCKKLSYQGAIRGEGGTRGTLVETTGDVNLYGGSLTYSENNSNGAIVNVLQGGKFTMNGGSLNSGYSINGGLIYNEGNVVINDGILVAGSADKGGAILNRGDVTLKGGTYAANKADLGSAIYNQYGTLKLQGNLAIKENNIYTENGKLEITGQLSGYIGIDTSVEGIIATGANNYTLTERDESVFTQ